MRYVSPCHLASPTSVLRTHRLGTLGSRLLSSLPTSVMQLGGVWEEVKNEEVETKYEGHREVRASNLDVSVAHSVGEESASCPRGRPSRRRAHQCQGVLPDKLPLCTRFLYQRPSTQSSPQHCEVGVTIPMSQMMTPRHRDIEWLATQCNS